MTDEILLETEDMMDKAVGAFERDLATIRTGRASTALVEHIMVEHYGQTMPLNQLATLGAPDAQLITVQPWDQGAIDSIMKAIQTSDLGINPSNDGVLVRLPIPPLTEERRRDLVKQVGREAEKHRVSLRNHRRDANDMLKDGQKEGEIPEDDSKRGHDQIQKLTDGFVEKIEEVLKQKEEDIMEV